MRFDEWALCVQHGACPALSDAGFGRGARPVINVSFDDARAYAQWLSKKSDTSYRLLSEAEWEYAARAGTSTARFWGDDPAQACRHANVADETARRQWPQFVTAFFTEQRWSFHNCPDGHALTAPAGSYRANVFGLSDMIGNVWEWVEDCYHADYRNAPDGAGAVMDEKCEMHVARGGSWYEDPAGARAAYRVRYGPGLRYGLLGFRLARTLP